MHVILLHKPASGEGRHSKEQLVGLLETAGYTVTYGSIEAEGWETILETAADLVLIGGGDGTVGAVARRLVGRGLPFAVLPLGTANNVARRLGWVGPPEAVVSRLASARRQPFDVGVAEGPWGMRRFIEGVGVGLFAQTTRFATVHEGELLPELEEAEDELERDLRLARAFLTELSPQRWRVELDGEVIDGTFLLLEAMNTGFVGPNLHLAPQADIGDGQLDVVLVGEAERAYLLDYLERRISGEANSPDLPVRQASRVRVGLEAARVHVDDALWPDEHTPPPASGMPFEVKLRLESGALTALVPAAD